MKKSFLRSDSICLDFSRLRRSLGRFAAYESSLRSLRNSWGRLDTSLKWILKVRMRDDHLIAQEWVWIGYSRNPRFDQNTVRDSRNINGIQNRLLDTGLWLLSGKQDSPKFGQRCGNGKENDIRDSDKKRSGCARMQDRNSFSISDPIRTKESGHCIVMWQFNIRGGGYSPIKVTGLLVVPFRGLNLWIGNAYGTKT